MILFLQPSLPGDDLRIRMLSLDQDCCTTLKYGTLAAICIETH